MSAEWESPAVGPGFAAGCEVVAVPRRQRLDYISGYAMFVLCT